VDTIESGRGRADDVGPEVGAGKRESSARLRASRRSSRSGQAGRRVMVGVGAPTPVTSGGRCPLAWLTFIHSEFTIKLLTAQYAVRHMRLGM